MLNPAVIKNAESCLSKSRVTGTIGITISIVVSKAIFISRSGTHTLNTVQ
jgi:hypothetical protein